MKLLADALKPGDTIGLVSPSNTIDDDEDYQAIEQWVNEEFAPEFKKGLVDDICFIRSTQSFGEVKYEKDWKDQKGFYPRRDGTGNCHHRNLDRSSCYRYRFIP